MGSYNTVFRSQILLRCNNPECNHSFELNKDFIAKREEANGFVPLKAKSSNTTIVCPKCYSTNFHVIFNYQNLYRRRCPKCQEMFETEKSWKDKCDKCTKAHAELMASMGPG